MRDSVGKSCVRNMWCGWSGVCACERAYVSSMFRFLIENGADPYWCDNSGKSVYLMAEKMQALECMQILRPQKIP